MRGELRFLASVVVAACAICGCAVAPVPVTPTPSQPRPTSPPTASPAHPTPTTAPSATPTPAASPQRTLLPSPAPLPTGGPAVTPTSYEEFALHVNESVAEFQVAAPAWFTFVRTLDGAAAAQAFSAGWLPDERDWIAIRRPADCYATSYAAWARSVAAIVDATGRARTADGTGMNPEFPGLWAGRFRDVYSFEPSLTFGCAPITAADFADHVKASIVTFRPAADGLYYWVKYLDFGGSGPDALRGKWFPAESRWLHLNDPQPCLEDRWHAWANAVGEMEAASRYLAPFGGMPPDTEARFLAARKTIENFDPAKGVAADC